MGSDSLHDAEDLVVEVPGPGHAVTLGMALEGEDLAPTRRHQGGHGQPARSTTDHCDVVALHLHRDPPRSGNNDRNYTTNRRRSSRSVTH